MGHFYADEDSNQIRGRYSARKSLPFHRQDQGCLCVCSFLPERRREADQIHSLYDLLTSYSFQPHINFTDQPPKRDIKISDQQVRNLTLAELQLTPSSILLLRFEDEALNRA